jgi:hypothetical protein
VCDGMERDTAGKKNMAIYEMSKQHWNARAVWVSEWVSEWGAVKSDGVGVRSSQVGRC